MTTKPQPQPPNVAPNLSQEMIAALDASAGDLRHDRVEDAAAFLERTQARIEAHCNARRP